VAQIVIFPAVEPVVCGWLQDVKVHVWSPDARPGDTCHCGASIYPADASKILTTELSGRSTWSHPI
jgi:hypothetical protein